MAKFQSPLLGYNNNVKHKSRVFHIQTEDSGVQHPHIITHLFMDGGRILKSVKRSYAEHVGTDNMSETVRQLMKEQHKAMFIALRDGQFDHLLPAAPAGTSAPKGAPSSPSLVAEKAASDLPHPGSKRVSSPPPTLVDPTPTPVAASGPPRLVLADSQPEIEAAPRTTRSRPSVDFDIPEPSTRVGLGTLSDTPPPATTKKPSTRPGRPPSNRPKAKSQPPGRPPSVRPPPADSRYAPARPTNIFGAASRAQPSIFRDDLIGDKSLDEVILSYLAEDLEPTSK